MSLAYKENVPDTRESPVREMVKELKEFGVDVYGYDTFLSKEEIESFDVKTLDFSFSTGFLLFKKKKCKVDCVIVAVAHDEFKNINCFNPQNPDKIHFRFYLRNLRVSAITYRYL